MFLEFGGLAISKGSDYAELAFLSDKDSSSIDLIHCDLRLENGVINFRDVALRAEKKTAFQFREILTWFIPPIRTFLMLY